MSNDERNSGGSGDGVNGGGRGGGSDLVDDVAEAGDATVVIVSDEYARQSLGRLVGVLRSAADRCERLGHLGDETAAEQEADVILEEMIEDMEEAEMFSGGTVRGLRRLQRMRRAERARRDTEKQGTT